MSTNVLAPLAALRDVDGVLGSFVLDAEGALLARDLPQIFDNELLSEIGPRVRRVAEGLSETGENPSSVVLHFKDHKLWIKPSDAFTLCVLGALQVNRASLRIALTLAARAVAPLLPQAGPGAAASTRAPDTLVSGRPPEAPPTLPSKRAIYRGRALDE